MQTWHGTLIELGLSTRTVKHSHKLLHRVLTDAVKNSTLARNVAAVHAPPSVEQDEIEGTLSETLEGVSTVDGRRDVRVSEHDKGAGWEDGNKFELRLEHRCEGRLAANEEAGDIEGAQREYGAAEKMVPDNLEMVFWHAVTMAGAGLAPCRRASRVIARACRASSRHADSAAARSAAGAP